MACDAAGNIVLFADLYESELQYDVYLNEMNATEKSRFRDLLTNLDKKVNARTLLASYGYYIVENLKSIS